MYRILIVLWFIFLVALSNSVPSGRVKAWVHAQSAQCWSLVAVGDSITLASGLTPYASLIATALSTSQSNQGISATGWNYNSGGTTGGSSLINVAPADVDPLRTSFSCAQPYLILAAGTNDIFYGASGATAYSSFITYVNARISAKWLPTEIIAMTIMQRAGDGMADRHTYNSSVISGQNTYGYRVADVAADPNMGCDSCNTNLTYFNSDQVHPTQAGQEIMAYIICQAMTPASGCPLY